MDEKELESIAKATTSKDFPAAAEKVKQTIENQPVALQAINRISDYRIPNPGVMRPINSEEANEYKSASELMRAISEEAIAWRNSLPKNYRPAILAVLNGGIQIHVESLSQISFNGIRIAGTLNGGPCSMMAHQSTVQLLCYGEEIVEEVTKNPIGFIWGCNKVEV